MFSLIIVEDELFMSDFLANFIDWNSIDVEVVGVYYNGKSALDGIIEKNPNIVLTDINMPVMSGLEMIEETLKKNIKTKFVVISGYNDFYLVKNAFKLGITEYFLKSELNPDELKNLVWKMKFTDREYQFKTEIDKKEPVLKDLIWGTKSLAELNRGIKLNIHKNMTVLVIDLLNYDDILKNQFDGDRELLRYGIMNILDELFYPESNAECFIEEYNKIVVIMSDEGNGVADEKIKGFSNEICKNLSKGLNFLTESGYAGSTAKTNELILLYDQAKHAAKYSFVHGSSEAQNYSKLAAEKSSVAINKAKLIVEFESFVFDFDFDTLYNNIDRFLLGNVTIDQLDLLFEIYRSYFIVLKHFANKHENFELEHGKFEQIIKTGSLAELNDYFEKTIKSLDEMFGYSSNIIVRMLKYIDQRYSENISLQDLADEFQIDYKKLSRLFIKRTGRSFVKYLTDVRMREALTLIKDTDFLLYEVAELVGYNNYSNFSRVFMKYYNKWPKDIERG